MKNTLISLFLVSAVGLSISSAGLAAEHHGSSAGHSEIGLGVASFSGAASGPAISGWFNLDGTNILQPLFAITNTRTNFGFSIGTLFKHYMSSGPTGWHLGGAFAIGTPGNAPATNPVNLLFGGVLGVHTTFGSSGNLLLQFDAGPTLSLLDGNADFAIGPFSTLLGASLIYAF